MKIVTLIARILLGLVFLVFGLNGFLNFLNTGPAPTGLAGQFLGALILSHYYWVVAVLQIAGGALLLVNRFVTLGVGADWADHREYHLFSRVHESDGSSPGGGGNNIVVHCFLSCSPTLLRNLCAEGVITS